VSSYFDEAQILRMQAEYPIGNAFLEGPARLSRDELHALQNGRFLKVVERAWQVPFYRRLWGERGIEPGDVRSLDDIAKLPTFSKADLMASIEANPPFGDYHGMDSLGEQPPSVVLHTTSGTTGRPQPL
jgi:phenylacetate-CoA ligase